MPMIVHLVDGTYELFRHFYGLRRFTKGSDRPLGAVVGRAAVGARDDRAGRDPRRRGHRPRDRVVPQRPLAGLQDRRGHRAGAVRRSSIRSRRRWWRWASSPGRWSSSRPTTRSPRRRASPPPTRAVEKVCIWTPDKDLAQCVRDDRVVQVDRRGKAIRDAAGVRAKFGVAPGADPRLAGAGRRCGRRLSGHRRHRRGRRGAAPEPARRDRGVPARRCSASSRNWPCSSSGSPPCAPTRSCSAASARCAGAGRPRRSPPGPSGPRRRVCSSEAGSPPRRRP